MPSRCVTFGVDRLLDSSRTFISTLGRDIIIGVVQEEPKLVSGSNMLERVLLIPEQTLEKLLRK
jgi:hypothetical protein